MPTYTATATDALAVHAVGVDHISHKTLELYLTPHGHHVVCDLSLSDYLEHRDAFRCDLLILACSALRKAEGALAELYRHTHREIPRVALLMPGEPDVPQTAETGWKFVLRAPLGSLDVLRTINAVMQRRQTRRVADGHRASAQAAPGTGRGEDEPVQGDGDAALQGLRSLAEETGLDAAAVRDLQRSFVTRGEDYLSSLEADLARGDLASLLVTCHAFKGMAGNMRFAQLRQTCESLEMDGKQGALAEARHRYQALRDQFQAIAARLQAE